MAVALGTLKVKALIIQWNYYTD